MENVSKTCLEYAIVVVAKVTDLTLGKGIGTRSQPFLDPKRHGMCFKG